MFKSKKLAALNRIIELLESQEQRLKALEDLLTHDLDIRHGIDRQLLDQVRYDTIEGLLRTVAHGVEKSNKN